MNRTMPAYAVDGRSVGREAFYAAACDPARSVIVEACAGAGKTWMLVSRILRALLDGAQANEILAITFTKKAAGEMRARLDEWLTAFSTYGCDEATRVSELRARGLDDTQARALAPVLAGLHERVLLSGRSVQVRTFHAWFSQLLSAAPLELLSSLGLQPDMDLVEDDTDHRPEVHRRFHAAVLADAQLREDFSALVRARGRAQARRWLDAAWDKRIEFELADAAGTLLDSVPAASEVWNEFAGMDHPSGCLHSAHVRAELSALAVALGTQAGATPRKQAVLLEQALELEDSRACLEGVRAALFTLKGELRKGLDAPGLSSASALLARIDRACGQQAAHEDHLRMVRLTRALMKEFAAYKRSRGLVDMPDLERCALMLLRDATLAGWVQERLDAQVRHLLIDEFQDTSPLQWHALHAWLAGYAGAGGGASGQRPPGVFIVGDPKQSIYRFRGAEPRVFDAARDFLVEAMGASVLACDHTRRNAPEVLAVLNDVFEAAQSQGDFTGFRAHTTELDAEAEGGVFLLPRVARGTDAETAPGATPAWRDSLATPRHEAEELLREQEARQVARAIQQLVADGGVGPGDIHVLCRKRESLRFAASALGALHLPFAAAEDFELLESPEARDLVALLDVLVSPQHKLSLAQALRSPVFGASDDDLVALATASGAHGGDWWRGLRDVADERPVLQRARDLLNRWHAAARRLPPHDLLDLVVAEGELRERVAAAEPPERRLAALAAIDAVLLQALTLDGARYATPYNFVRALRRRAIKVPAALQRDAVQLLTVHGAKGLEAQVVFVMDADPEAKTPDTATLLVDWPVESEYPRHCAFVYAQSQCPPSLEPVLERELAARQREELNGLYVAMTRAKRRLVFSATEPHRSASRASWWQRVMAHAQPMPVPSLPARQALPAAGAAVLDDLPRWRHVAQQLPLVLAADDDANSRLGQAVHRVLEWISAAQRGGESDIELHSRAAATEFGVDEREVARLAGRIWGSPACARFFAGPGLRWAGNEVPVSDAGEVLRIDRLVDLDDSGQRSWWVLDYKLQHSPDSLPAYREQLQRYRRAVQALQPDQPVRCAFITGAGELIELD